MDLTIRVGGSAVSPTNCVLSTALFASSTTSGTLSHECDLGTAGTKIKIGVTLGSSDRYALFDYEVWQTQAGSEVRASEERRRDATRTTTYYSLSLTPF